MDKTTSVLAKEADGNIQITFTIPYELIKKAQEDTVAEMAKDIEIPGFRKGNAPLAKVRERISEGTLVEHSLSHILPKALAEAINENKLKIAIYPKFELISAKENEAWQVRGITCELPDISLGDYKAAVTGSMAASKIIVPGKEIKQPSKEEKEQAVISALLTNVKVTIPKILVDEEVSSRLSNLLGRLEKLGLALESYLTSISKSVDQLRAEYEIQSRGAIALDLILSKIADQEGLKASETEVASALNMSTSTTNKKVENSEDLESRKRLIESILKRRQALDYLISLA
ncbi:MAG TPA: trigger factor [Patescibacteria group bacterium]|nr:trigger factor [Patescibacteria group bacterium]